MALLAAVCVLLVDLGTACARPGVFDLLSSEGAGGVLARQLVPFAVILPVLLGGLRIAGEKLGLFGAEFGTSLVIVSLVVLLLALIARAAFVVDRSERARRASETRARESDRLAEMNVLKTQLLNTVSHELNTPLTALKMQTHILASGTIAGQPEAQAKSMEIVARNVARLDRIVQDMLEAARFQAGEGGQPHEAVDFAEQARAAATELAAEATRRDLILHVDAPAPVPVVGNADRLKRAVRNLVGNAVKFTPPGGTIEVRAFCDGKGGVVRVTDNGPGIGHEDLLRLFQPFSQSREAAERTDSGSGLGLYLTKGIATEHRGRVTAASDGPGRGASFVILIPIRAASPSSAAG
ncbi:MAG: sensor histidine kinase [Thermoplasmatota archaeon]